MDAQTAAGWVVTAKERGIQAKQLNMGFITLARNISGAAQGSTASAKAFAQLGLNAAALKQQTPTVQMSMLADSFKALHNGVDKAALAQKLFGRQAQTLLPLLNKGGKALSEQVTELGKQSGMNNASVKSGLSLVAQQRKMEAATLGVKVAIGTALVPILTALSQVMAPIALAFAHLMQGSTGFRVAIVALTAGLVAFIAISKLVALAGIEVEGAWIWALIVPAALIAIGVAFVMLYQKVGWFRNAVQAALHGVVAAINWVKQAAVDVFHWISSNWKLLASILTAPFLGPTVLIVTHLHQIANVAKSVASTIGKAFAAAFSAVISAARGAINFIIRGWNSLQFKIPGFKVGPVHFGGTSIGVPAIPTLAEGGTLASSGLAVVGERGPELVSLPGGATVFPNGSGGGVVHTHVYLDGREIAYAMGDYAAGQQAAR